MNQTTKLKWTENEEEEAEAKFVADWSEGAAREYRGELEVEFKKQIDLNQIKKSKKEYGEKMVKSMEACRNEREFWDLTKKSRKGVNKAIIKEEWYNYFKESHEGSDTIIARERSTIHRKGIRIEINEVKAAIKKLKKNRAAGEDNIKAEAWMEGGEEMIEQLTRVLNKISTGGEIPVGWTKGQVVPVYKKGDRNKV